MPQISPIYCRPVCVRAKNVMRDPPTKHHHPRFNPLRSMLLSGIALSEMGQKRTSDSDGLVSGFWVKADMALADENVRL